MRQSNRLTINFLTLVLTAIHLFAAAQKHDFAALVDPFIGTGDHGHTYPGAVLPFGMVQLSPDTRMVNWDGSSGYHYSDSTIIGFSHTHLSGTGEPELCDILVMPTTGPVNLKSGTDSRDGKGYLSTFRHENETAEPGYYSVLLDKYNVRAELTATYRTGFHCYTYPDKTSPNILIDLKHRGKILESAIDLVNDTTITGYTITTGWAEKKHIFFYARFSRPIMKAKIAINDTIIEGIRKAAGKNLKASLTFNASGDNRILVKVGISSVGCDGARKNLESENPGWDFQRIKSSARVAWNQYLSKIEIEGGTVEERKIFYSSLYHTALAPNLFMDVDRNYFGQDYKIHSAGNFTNYTVFSLWDVFRTQMPLFTIIEPSRMKDFLKAFMEMYKIGGRIPRFEIFGTLSDNMIGYHSLPVILDAWQKGIRVTDGDLTLKAMKAVMEIPEFNNFGYIPADTEGSGGCVARVMEHCYNAWCVAEMARSLDIKNDQLLYEQRAQFYKNLYDRSTGFMRPRNSDYSWVTPFDPAEPSGFYVEGNAYQYSAFVPHDINSLITMHGGNKNFENWLDTLFTHKSKYDRNVVDASGLIGQYAHGNEPSHEIAYLYTYAGAAPKTQFFVRKIMKSLYNTSPGGISGNEDCGQMSAWYVMSAMGFYPVLPGSPNYIIGSPLFNKVTINLENGRKFIIRAGNNGHSNYYIQSSSLNGQPYSKSWIRHEDITGGGELYFEMGKDPNYNWGTALMDRPTTRAMVKSVRMPYYRVAENYFMDTATVSLGCETDGATIFYSIDGTEPTKQSLRYDGPFKLCQSSELRFFATKEGLRSSCVVAARIEKMKPVGLTILKDYSSLDLVPGLRFNYFEEHVMRVDELDKLPPKKSGLVPNFSLNQRDQDGLFAFIWDGFIKIPSDGIYTFYLSSNDGGVLYLDGSRFIDQDGPHTAVPSARTVRLNRGTYRISEKYFQMGGAFSNNVMWKGPGITKEIIPPTVLFHETGK